ncbi:hypothetical protein AB0J74_25680 [Asanoa sp. NPDC049573]|uniref:hypothetical protein n=1 Tax=Asanoa sp. NPDC049573 TaxID=3155396 RepID=UPI00341A0FA8
MDTTGVVRRRWTAPALVMVAVAWVAALVIIQQVGYLLRVDRINNGQPLSDEGMRATYHRAQLFAVVLVAGPGLAWAIALAGGRRLLAYVTGGLLLLSIPVALLIQREADQRWNPPPPPPPGTCVEYSGGANSCPGG